LPTNWAVTEMQYFVIWFCFYRAIVLVWFCEPSHDWINIDTVNVYLNRFTSSSCHCLWKYIISELLIVHENAICLFQGLLILTCNVEMTLLKKILRELVISGHPVLSGTSKGSEGVCLTQVSLYFPL